MPYVRESAGKPQATAAQPTATGSSECSTQPKAQAKTAVGGSPGSLRTHKNSSEFDIHDATAFSLAPLSKLRFALHNNTAADLVEAGDAIWDLNQRPTKLDKTVYADAFLNIEALASVRMDGKQPSADTIFYEKAAASFAPGTSIDFLIRYQRDRNALEYALELAREDCSVESLCKLHGKALPPRHSGMGGILRDNLKQVGGSRYHLFGGAYAMPAPEDVELLLEDCTRFMNDTGIPVVEQAGIAHAQLVNIHPFERGNGKMARMAIYIILRHQNASPHLLLPFTPSIVTSNHDYVAGIDACRFGLDTPKQEVEQNANAWLQYFSACCLKSVGMCSRFMAECEEFYEKQVGRLSLRKDSASFKLLRSLPAIPTFTVQMAADYLGCSFKRASEAAKQLAAEGVIELL
ncbi:MAG: Fic family protein, partial [Coriobacteriales bacterium]